MPDISTARRPGGFWARAATAVAVVLASVILAGCSASTAASSFDPSSPCVTDTKVAGAYPALEARIPAMIGTAARISLDSGRNCTAAQLGTLATHGVTDVQFAGGVWQDGAQSGITLAVFTAPGLRPEWIGEWYEATARAGRVTGLLQPSRPIIDGQQAYRLDLVNGESPQTVITLPSEAPDTVRVILAAEEPETRIQEAIAAFAGR